MNLKRVGDDAYEAEHNGFDYHIRLEGKKKWIVDKFKSTAGTYQGTESVGSLVAAIDFIEEDGKEQTKAPSKTGDLLAKIAACLVGLPVRRNPGQDDATMAEAKIFKMLDDAGYLTRNQRSEIIPGEKLKAWREKKRG